MSYAFSKTVDDSFEDAVERVTERLAEEGFGGITCPPFRCERQVGPQEEGCEEGNQKVNTKEEGGQKEACQEGGNLEIRANQRVNLTA